MKALEKKAKKAPDEVKSQLKAFLQVQSQYAHTHLQQVVRLAVTYTGDIVTLECADTHIPGTDQ